MRAYNAFPLVVVLGVSACAETRPPNVIVIVIDTLRADRLGAYGNRHGLTPFLDELADRGTVFTNAYAPSSWTVPSVASLMTSRYPSQHHVIGFGSRLAEYERTFAEALQPLRYLSSGFSANILLMERLGFSQGFHYWRADPKAPEGLSAAELRQQALQWLEDARWTAGASPPVLMYVQFMEPHAPYDPPEPYRSRARADQSAQVIATMRENAEKGEWHKMTRDDAAAFERLYDGDVAHVDAEISLFFTDLQRRGLLDNAIVFITADHGEEFWEHRGMYHGKTLFDESVRIPLILIAPGYRAGQRVDENVSLLDIAPTVVDLVGLPPESSFEGRSLRPLLHRSSLLSRLGVPLGQPRSQPPAADILLELHPKMGRQYDNRRHAQGIVRHRVKLLIGRDSALESYDLTSDPGELSANPDSLQPAASALAAALHDEITALGRRSGVPLEPAELDAATKEQLRALGYNP